MRSSDPSISVLNATKSLVEATRYVAKLELQVREYFEIGLALRFFQRAPDELKNHLPAVESFVKWLLSKLGDTILLSSWRLPLKVPEGRSQATRFINRNLPDLLEKVAEIEKATNAPLVRGLTAKVASIVELASAEGHLNLHIFVGVTMGWLVHHLLVGTD